MAALPTIVDVEDALDDLLHRLPELTFDTVGEGDAPPADRRRDAALDCQATELVRPTLGTTDQDAAAAQVDNDHDTDYEGIAGLFCTSPRADAPTPGSRTATPGIIELVNDDNIDHVEKNNDDDDDDKGIAALFSTADPPALSMPLPRLRTRQRKTYDMSTVRRSTRLSKKPAIPAEEKAQRNLCRKLGIPTDELAPIEDVIRDLVTTFRRPLPEPMMAAMTVLFDLENEDRDNIDDVLTQHVGEQAAEVQANDG